MRFFLTCILLMGWSMGYAQTTCGNAFYDDGNAFSAAEFAGQEADNPDFMYAVFIDVTDFGFTLGETGISGFCVGNQLAFTGGPWMNRVFVYPDNGGVPDDSVVLASAFIHTGDGTGQVEIEFPEPIMLEGNVWLINRGDPANGDTDFNMEFEITAPTGHSYSSENGIAGLTQRFNADYIMRANLVEMVPPPFLMRDFILDGKQSTPPVVTNSQGFGDVELNHDQTSLSVVINHDVPNPTAAGIYRGIPGEVGTLVHAFSNGISPITGEWALAPDDVNDLLAGNLYVNINSQLNPLGEIRGQIYCYSHSTYTAAVENWPEENILDVMSIQFCLD